MADRLRRPFLSSTVGLTAIYLFIAAATAVKISVHEINCSHLIGQIADRQDMNAVTTMDAELKANGMGYFTRLVLRLISPSKSTVAMAVKNQQEILSLIKQLKQEYFSSANASLALVGFTAFFLLAIGRGGGGEAARSRRKLYALLSVSAIFFALGIFLPVLTAVVKGSHMLIGGFIIQTSSKGIVSTIHTLIKSGDWIIAILLFGFSIGIPIFKGVAALSVSLTRSEQRRLKVARLLESVGRWALTDVLVAAVLLGCFSLNAIQQPDGGVIAIPRFAFGFFVLYTILAARTSSVLKSAARTGPGPTPAGIRRTAAIVAGALLAGAGCGVLLFENNSLAREAGNLAVVKLVRTHAELVSEKVRVSSGHPAMVPFEPPYEGTLSIDVKVPRSRRVDIALVRDHSDSKDPAESKKTTPVPGWQAVTDKPYVRKARIGSGKYDLVIRNESGDAGLFGERLRVHITLDP